MPGSEKLRLATASCSCDNILLARIQRETGRTGRNEDVWRPRFGSRPSGTTGPISRRLSRVPGLREACHELDLPEPIWLDKNEREWEEFGMTRFLPDAFFEAVPFERIEIEFIDPDAPKKKNRDPRNAF